MLLGIGNDLVEVERIRALFEKKGESFLKRVFTEEEVRYCLSHADPAPYLAARFAAKEAVAKAWGTGLGKNLNWTDIEVTKNREGKPMIVLSSRCKERFPQSTIWLSISHTKRYALATVVIESK
jgi:holo-[acyl-carrier protein] synthase